MTDLLRVAHEALKRVVGEDATGFLGDLLVEPVEFRTGLETFDEPPEVGEVEVTPVLHVCLLSHVPTFVSIPAEKKKKTNECLP